MLKAGPFSAAESIQSLLSDEKFSSVAELYTEDELKERIQMMLQVVSTVLQGKTVHSFSFDESNRQYWSLEDNRIHFGLGILKMLIESWRNMEVVLILDAIQELGLKSVLEDFLSGQLPPHERELLLNWKVPGFNLPLIKILVDACLQKVAAHEAGHRCIDKNPVEDLGMSEKYIRIGFGSLAGSVLDCAVDSWVKHHIRDKSRVGVAIGDLCLVYYDYAFGSEQLDWVRGSDHRIQRNGYIMLFDQFMMEVMRIWIKGVNGAEITPDTLESFVDPATDPRIIELLRRQITVGKQMRTVWDQLTRIWDVHGSCLPGKNDSEIDVKIAFRNKLMALEPVFDLYESELVARDRVNQVIHQSISAFGLKAAGHPLPAAVQKRMDELLHALPGDLRQELEAHLEAQLEGKRAWMLQQLDFELYQKGVRSILNEMQSEVELENAFGLNSETLFDVLGPAVLIEEKRYGGDLSSELRKWLESGFNDLRDLAYNSGEELSKAAKEVFGDPDAPIKDREAEIVDKTRPQVQHMGVPAMHDPIEANTPSPKVPPPQWNLPELQNLIEIPKSQLDEAREWLQRTVNISQRVQDFRHALRFLVQSGISFSNTGEVLDIDRAIKKSIARDVKDPNIDFNVFEHRDTPEQRHFKLSIVIRTMYMSPQDLLKFLLYLEAIGSDRSVSSFLDMEIILSQNVPEIPQPDQHPGAVVKAFGESFIRDWDVIEPRILAIKKYPTHLPITDDAGTLHLTRKRLAVALSSIQNRKVTGLILDIWDGKVMGDPMAFHLGHAHGFQGSPNRTVKDHLALLEKNPWDERFQDFFRDYQDEICRLCAMSLAQLQDQTVAQVWSQLKQKLTPYQDTMIAIRRAREQFEGRVFSIHFANHPDSRLIARLRETYGDGHFVVENKVRRMIDYLDILLHHMIKNPSNPAQGLVEEWRQQKVIIT